MHAYDTCTSLRQTEKTAKINSVAIPVTNMNFTSIETRQETQNPSQSTSTLTITRPSGCVECLYPATGSPAVHGKDLAVPGFNYMIVIQTKPRMTPANNTGLFVYTSQHNLTKKRVTGQEEHSEQLQVRAIKWLCW